MKIKKLVFASVCVMCTVFAFSAVKSVPAEKGIKKIATVAESFGDGEKVSAVIITYSNKIDAASVNLNSYTVECIENGKTVLRTVEEVSVDGKNVTLKLAYVNKWDATNGKMPQRPKSSEGENVQADNGPRFDDDGVPVDVTASITQIADIKAKNGTIYKAGSTSIKSTSSTELVLQDFKKYYFTDKETGITLPYFVYLPKNRQSMNQL
ncbi:hypothetical protein [Treponema sp.]|uniref:hypothetical protein n=1 Tax=Treponema sp. TaxID=166 RepID=UPI00388D5E9C